MSQNNKETLNRYLIAANIAYRLMETIKLEVNKELKSKNLYYKHWIILKLIYFNEAKTSTDIASIISINKSSLSRLIDYLETESLVERRKESYDRRQTNLLLTDNGRNIFSLGYDAFIKVPELFENSNSNNPFAKIASLNNFKFKKEPTLESVN